MRGVATRTNALWQRKLSLLSIRSNQSQPARMRCGKGHSELRAVCSFCRNPHECAVAKAYCVETTAGTRPSQPARMRCGKGSKCTNKRKDISRNPHECAVAKIVTCMDVDKDSVATRTNALWQSVTKLQALTSLSSQPARMRCGKDNTIPTTHTINKSQPARMRCGKAFDVYNYTAFFRSQPARMRCGKVFYDSPVETAPVATRTNALWQRLLA